MNICNVCCLICSIRLFVIAFGWVFLFLCSTKSDYSELFELDSSWDQCWSGVFVWRRSRFGKDCFELYVCVVLDWGIRLRFKIGLLLL